MTEVLSVLIVDDEPEVRRAIARLLGRVGHETTTVASGEECLSVYRKRHFDLVLLDLGLPGKSGLDVLDELATIERSTTIVVTANDQLATAVECMRRGAFDFVTKQTLDAQLLPAIERAAVKLRRERILEAACRTDPRRVGELLGESSAMLKVFDLIRKGATKSPDATILIMGESGTGKELAAKAIHEKSPRHEGPFVPINCTAFQENLLESEFFGHEKGAFTGADIAKPGLFEVARDGTVFLDEIGDMPAQLQAKLLRFLQNHTFYRVGGIRERHSDVRILAATNQNLGELVKQQRFREDLFFRLNVFPVRLPPLRERQPDIPILARHFLDELCRKLRLPPKTLNEDAASALCQYSWPGNVRELRNVIERLLIMTDADTAEIRAHHLPEEICPRAPGVRPPTSFSTMTYTDAKQVFLTHFDTTYIAEALAQSEGIVSRAARRAGMDRANWRRLMRRHGITVENFRSFLPGS
jgi:DNA-binding NtrC family response regulator